MQNGTNLTPEEHHRMGLGLLDRGKGREAVDHLKRAHAREPNNPKYCSSYALARALVQREFLGAADLARSALRAQFYNPDLYLNLARIYLAHDFKSEAVRVLRRGLMLDPEHPRIAQHLARLGIRRRPPIPFLGRGHLLNRLLGKVQFHVMGAIPPVGSGVFQA